MSAENKQPKEIRADETDLELIQRSCKVAKLMLNTIMLHSDATKHVPVYALT